MSLQYYNPFNNLYFNNNTCFLTGEEIEEQQNYITVFPEWVLDRFLLHDKKFTLMDNVTSFNYNQMVLPCSTKVKNAYNLLDQEIKAAFENGYQSVQEIDSQKLFTWMGVFVYCVLYQDLLIEKEKKQKQNVEFDISPTLKNRFALFHLMLQSLVAPISFGAIKPWGITIVKLKYSKDIFNYRDDTVNLMFTLGMNGFGIIATLQDNGIVMQKEQALLHKINQATLHPIQFEELKARFIYNNYLLQFKPKYIIKQHADCLDINAVEFKANDISTLFANWNEKTFADVLSEYWKPWGLKKNEIYTFPNAPLSFLENENTYNFIEPDTIDLPY